MLQYLQDSGHDDNNKNYKNYLIWGPCTTCRKMTHKENLEQSHHIKNKIRLAWNYCLMVVMIIQNFDM